LVELPPPTIHFETLIPDPQCGGRAKPQAVAEKRQKTGFGKLCTGQPKSYRGYASSGTLFAGTLPHPEFYALRAGADIMPRTQNKTNWKATWKGQLRFGLVSFTVEAVNVRAKEEGNIHFHQLHAKCHSRIRYEKVCPLHGKVSNSEIVSGYEYAPGKYVEIDPAELGALRTEDERSLTIDDFIKPDQVDPIYLDGRTYYLVPGGKEAVEPYQVLCEAMRHRERCGVGHVIMSGREQLVLVRPKDGTLVMAMLLFPAELRPAQDLELETPRKVDARKTRLAENLIQSWSQGRFRFENYENHYREHLEELIDAKVAGREVVTPAETERAPVINLMDALKRSLARTTNKSKPAAVSKRRSVPKAKAKRKRAS
jgi:DNA end-binding protein Ku